ncbi:MAG TPA: hypothetical protein VKP52_06325 [Pseudolabrys sp.]|nr:hypothetical protein [Pseudolabrys sp.]
MRVAVGDAAVATLTSEYVPFNWIRIFKVTLGQKVAALSDDGIAGTLSVTELTN